MKTTEHFKSVKLEHDDTFYDSFDESTLMKPKMELDESELEEDSDDDTESIVSSAFSNDHNYNMSPRVSSPDTCLTSDPGYESHDSPATDPIINLDEFDLWDISSDPITELFPSLV